MNKKIVGRCLLPELLHRRDMTQVDLSLLTGIPKSQINEYIKHKRVMSLGIAKIIATALKCYIDDLYEWNIRG